MLEEHLSIDEIRRANRYRQERDRSRYIVAHGVLRELLADYMALSPRDISFGHTEKGKPFLKGGGGEQRLRFNLSHSGEWAAVGFALSTEVGIDIEQIDLSVSIEAVARRFFSNSEFEAIQAIPLEQRTAAFFTTWTRKEAYVKARGDGIADRLRNFRVSVDPEQSAILLTDSIDPHAIASWKIYDLNIAHGYAAAIAAEGATHQIRIMRWTHPLF
ncbi:MAG: 4'-phosphopantetheinyl transferase superfamily protein [Candidatus Bipolaricaulota bacterium]|nr:4'-phosphopantetheinyl transferase superfamily protein [Candidatus Bipolaricaulota bacterium]